MQRVCRVRSPPSRVEGTLGEMFDVIRSSDFAIVLISDAAMAEHYQAIFEALKPQDPIVLAGRRRLSSMIFA